MDIRPMRIDELEATILAIRDGGWGDRRRELGLYVRDTAMLVLVAEDEGTIVGTTLASASSGIGWIGLVFVAPSMRGRGLGSTLTRAGLTHLQASGCRSILLAASAMGQPMYERLGFVAEDSYVIMRGPRRVADSAAADTARAVCPEDLPRIIALDRAATGEDRRHLLEALPHGWIAERGYALHGGGGFGPVIAEDSASGEALLSVLCASSPEPEVTVRVPRSNTPAMQFLASRGFAERGALPRMRLGDPVAWRPDRIWAIFNFALG